MRDYYYYPINPPPLPVTIPSTRNKKSGSEDDSLSQDKEFIYFRREDTGEHY